MHNSSFVPSDLGLVNLGCVGTGYRSVQNPQARLELPDRAPSEVYKEPGFSSHISGEATWNPNWTPHLLVRQFGGAPKGGYCYCVCSKGEVNCAFFPWFSKTQMFDRLWTLPSVIKNHPSVIADSRFGWKLPWFTVNFKTKVSFCGNTEARKPHQAWRPQRHNLTLQHPQGNCHRCRFHGSVVLCYVQITGKSSLHFFARGQQNPETLCAAEKS